MEHTALPRVCVVGAGAIGGFFGVRLADGHADVSVLARGRTLAAIRERGWVLESPTGRLVGKVRASDDPAALGPQDIVIVAVKGYSLPQVAPLLAPLLGPSTVIVPALNGVPWWFTLGGAGLPVDGRLDSVDASGVVEAAIPVETVVGSVVYPACSTPEPGVVRHASGTRVVFGEAAGPPGAAVTDRVHALVSLLGRAGFDAEATGDIRNEVWKKLLGNACFNSVSLVTGSATDLLIDDPRVHALFVSMMAEALAVGRALGIVVPIEPAARIAITRKLGHIKTSTLYDAEAGRPVEIDGILGALVELAEKTGVPAPTCGTVYALARARARTFGLLPA